ncbi:MAG: hypothetical protein M1817_004750 [Caeruleum heppii]|nr:MAG: hypothetical protein M1817_004750 [Caeruleum heppii]
MAGETEGSSRRERMTLAKQGVAAENPGLVIDHDRPKLDLVKTLSSDLAKAAFAHTSILSS